MPDLDSMRDGTHWRERAKEARMTADACDRPEEKRMMLAIARSYDALAERAEKRFAENNKPTRVVGWPALRGHADRSAPARGWPRIVRTLSVLLHGGQ
jgi:hypothetical protein